MIKSKEIVKEDSSVNLISSISCYIENSFVSKLKLNLSSCASIAALLAHMRLKQESALPEVLFSQLKDFPAILRLIDTVKDSVYSFIEEFNSYLLKLDSLRDDSNERIKLVLKSDDELNTHILENNVVDNYIHILKVTSLLMNDILYKGFIDLKDSLKSIGNLNIDHFYSIKDTYSSMEFKVVLMSRNFNSLLKDILSFLDIYSSKNILNVN